MNSKWVRNLGGIILLALLAFSLFQASWIAPDPEGRIKLVANNPVDLPRGGDGCIRTARIGYRQTPVSDSTRMLQTAVGNSADAIVIDYEMVGGQLVLPLYFKSGCAADNAKPRGPVSEAMEALSKPEQFVRIYSADDAQKIVGAAPDRGEERIFFATREADLGVAADKPSFSIEKARQCVRDYRLSGIWGSVPESCKNGTALLTLSDMGYTLWGWPNRFMARMADNNVRVIIAADAASEGISGLTDLSQYSDIASSYRGYIWIDDIETMGPSLRR